MTDEPGTEPDLADTDWQAEADKWKALARKHEDNAKANSVAAKKLAEIEAANKTAEEKATEKTTAAERRAEEAEMRLLKRDIAEAAGLPRAWADRLQGSTQAELEADAKQLAKDLTPQQQQTSARAVPELRSGALPPSDNQPLNADDWIRAKARR